MKLELKHLAGYLPYKLKGIMYYGGCVREDVELGLMDIPVWLNGSYPIKPILRPLSDLTKEIEVNGEKFVPNKILNSIFRHRSKDLLPYKSFNYNLELVIETENYSQEIDLFDGFLIVHKLLEWHFDIYGLIENGLAIDINTLNK